MNTLDIYHDAIRSLESIGILLHNNSLCFLSSENNSLLWDHILPLCSFVDDKNDSNHTLEYFQTVPTDTLRHHRHLVEHHAFTSVEAEDFFYVYNIVGTVLSILFVALIAGLYLGLLTLDALDLEIIQRVSIDDHEIMYATNLLPIVKQRHRLLVTLLILNALAYESLPIFLSSLVPDWVTILLSTTLILVFGEILPSAIFTGPNQLMLGNMLAPLTLFFMWLLTPVAVPLASVLDYLVHGYVLDPKNPYQDSEPAYNRAELSALIRIQHESRMAAARNTNKSITLVKNKKVFIEKKKDESWNAIKKEIMEKVNERIEVLSERGGVNNGHHHHHHHHHSSVADRDGFLVDVAEDGSLPEVAMEQLNPPLHPTEVDLVTGALQMKTKLVMDEYTPLRKIYALPNDLVLDLQVCATIYAKGYSRMPVYQVNENDPDDRSAILGFLMIRQLILIDWDHGRKLSTLPLQRPDCVSPRMNLVDALELLRTGGTLMAFVCAAPDIASKALENEKPIPVEAGFMGVITLEDIMESILQGKVYDEWDMKDRERAIGTLQRWAVLKLQNFVRRRRKSGNISNKSDHDRQKSTPYTSSTLSPIKEITIHRTASMGDDTLHSNTENHHPQQGDDYNNYGNDYYWDNHDAIVDQPNRTPTPTTPLLLEAGISRQYT